MRSKGEVFKMVGHRIRREKNTSFPYPDSHRVGNLYRLEKLIEGESAVLEWIGKSRFTCTSKVEDIRDSGKRIVVVTQNSHYIFEREDGNGGIQGDGKEGVLE